MRALGVKPELQFTSGGGGASAGHCCIHYTYNADNFCEKGNYNKRVACAQTNKENILNRPKLEFTKMMWNFNAFCVFIKIILIRLAQTMCHEGHLL